MVLAIDLWHLDSLALGNHPTSRIQDANA
uniref:Uncharacterized protein n=1 Tax=Rhizophora mucronata TaxID=61149 RepID=A0A2P2QQJ0_RHIMU